MFVTVLWTTYFGLITVCVCRQLGYTALMGASINGRVDLVDLLVSNGADVTLKTTVRFLKLLKALITIYIYITTFNLLTVVVIK